MKVFFPLEVFYPSQAGGTSNTVYWLTKNLVKEGFEPVLVASDKGILPGFPLNRWLENESGRVIHVRTRHLHFPVGQTFYSLRHFHNSDVVHISSVFYPTAFITAIAARLFGKKTIWSVHGELDPHALNHSRGRKTPILRAIRWLVGDYAVFHSTCEEETGYIRDVFGTDARVVEIPNFIEMPEQVERSAGNYLLYIGRIHPKKGLENLFQALAMSEPFLESDMVLKIAGKGWQAGYEDQLRKLVTDLGMNHKIHFVGHVEGIEKEKMLADATWTIMPSHTENFGLVVLESLAQNTPVIASKGTPWEVLEKERLGFWTENSPEALAEIVARIIAMSPQEYADYRSRGRAFVEENYDMRKNIGRWVEAYRGMV
jgi:glycosyltransferase involved in cell wall biosynthesis